LTVSSRGPVVKYGSYYDLMVTVDANPDENTFIFYKKVFIDFARKLHTEMNGNIMVKEIVIDGFGNVKF
jgi:hypothetical protein